MSKGGSKTTTQSQSTQIDPAYLGKWNDIYSTASNIAGQPYNPYTGQMTAGFTGGQNSAYGAAGTNLTGAQGLNSYGLLGSLMGQNAGQIAGSDLSAYMNPYTQNVVDTTLNQIDKQRVKALHGVGDQAQSAGAFGGDRQAILEAETNKQYGDLAGQTAANLYTNAYNNAQNMRQQDITNSLNNLQQQAQLAQMGIGSQNNAINQMYQIGTGEQQTQQAALDAAYKQYLEGRDWNKNNLSWQANLLKAMPYNTTTTGTSTESKSGNPFSSLLGTAALGFTPLSSGGSSLFGGLGSLLGIG
mgnify:CR=1 FL=1